MITEDSPVIGEGPIYQNQESYLIKFLYDDYVCYGRILSYLFDSLYDIFFNIRISKELWESLKRKYDKECVGLKKYIVGQYFDYKMADSYSILKQVHEP